MTRYGWLIVYHGVSEMEGPSKQVHPLCYTAGVMALSKEHPQLIRYRSAKRVLAPELPEERTGQSRVSSSRPASTVATTSAYQSAMLQYASNARANLRNNDVQSF
jgi:hypothetical protein